TEVAAGSRRATARAAVARRRSARGRHRRGEPDGLAQPPPTSTSGTHDDRGPGGAHAVIVRATTAGARLGDRTTGAGSPGRAPPACADRRSAAPTRRSRRR